MFISKLIKLTHFLARNNLSVKELYPKIVEFLSEEMEEPVVKHYLDSAAKNVIYIGKDSCDSFLKSMNSYSSDQVNKGLQVAEDIVMFADEATSNNRKEMMGSLWPTLVKRPNASNWTLSGFFLFLLRTLRSYLIKSKRCLLKEILIS